MSQPSKQTGAALAVSLFMLAVLTLVGVAAINTGTVNFRLVNNLQAQQEAEMILRTQMEQFMSQAAPFGMDNTSCDPDGPDGQNVTVNGRTVHVNIEPPTYAGARQQAGNSLGKGIFFWDVRATAHDLASGAHVVAHWGVGIQLLGTRTFITTNNPC